MNAKEFMEKYCLNLDAAVLNKKIYIQNLSDLKKYIKNLVVPMLNCAYLENKYLIFTSIVSFSVCVIPSSSSVVVIEVFPFCETTSAVTRVKFFECF